MRCKTGVILLSLVLTLFMTVSVLGDINDNVTYQGNKARVTVGNIKDKADHCDRDMAAAVGEMLSTALANNPKFIVLAGKEDTEELMDEIDLGESDYVEDGRGPEKGLMEGADVLITGAVTMFEPNAGGTGGGLGGLTKKAFGAVGASKKKAKIAIDLKMYDIRTRRVIKATKVEAESSKWKVGGVGGGWSKDLALVGALGTYANEPMEDAVRLVLEKTVDEIADEMPQEYYRYQGQGQYNKEYGAGGQTGQTAAAGQNAAAQGQVAAAVATKPAPVAKDMKLYTKYDFIPGDKVFFYDDMSNEEEGEFPYRWNLEYGVFEIARMGGEYWILCTDNGYLKPRIPDAPLPEKYTVEMEFYNNGPEVGGNKFVFVWVDAKGKKIAECGISGKQPTWFSVGGKTLADKYLPERLTKGVHNMRVMATSRSLKFYIDQERVANIPKVDNFNPVGFKVYVMPRGDTKDPALFRGFRFAEGGKSFREQMNETGRVVTHGILFDSDSYTIKGESFKTLKEIGEMLTEEPGLRIRIEGHTDSDGADDHNMELSKNRAEAVKSYLVQEYGIGADRMECQGKGESAPIDTNDSPEGKANNRRVELVKI